MDENTSKASDESPFLTEAQKINARLLLNQKAVSDLLHPKPTTPKLNATLELIAQSIKLRRQIVDAVGGPAAQAIIEQSIKTKRMARDALKAGVGTGVVPMPDFPKTPLAVEMQRAEEHRRLSLAAAEGEARARAEFKTRLELEAAHQKELQATTTVTLPPPAPAPTALGRQDARWQACVSAGLAMPTDTYGPYPRGIAEVAKSLGIARQTLTDDLNKYRERMFDN
jgi:hypothetical protein